MSTLVVVAHPDDETLGAGGTIAKLADEGERVHVLILGKSRVPERHTEAAIKHLGATYTQYELPDQKFETLPLTSIVRIIEDAIADDRPHTVYTHHPADLNLDHTITYRAAMTACRPTGVCPVVAVYAMEIPSSTEWGQAHGFQPNTYVDISDTLLRKNEAMALYETEARDWPHPRSEVALTALAVVRGSAAGVHAAEAFQQIRRIDA